MSEEKKPYIILQVDSRMVLMEAVAGQLKEGYVPLGGAQIVVHRPAGRLTGTVFKFYQTMVFNEA